MNKIITKLMVTTVVLGSLVFAGDLLGAGATFPQPLYSKLFDVYSKSVGTKVNYQGIGSGGGIKQITAKVIDFGGTDAFMTDAELKSAGAPIVHVPTCLGAVALSYNLPGNPQLKFPAQLVSDIFSGKIAKWNDPAIMAANPGAVLPATDIFVAYRSDSSGTTAIFTDYLSKIDSKNWTMDKTFKTKSKLGIGGKGNSGVAGLIKQLPGTIGYVELAYAKQNKMSIASIQNKSGVYVTPTLENASLSAAVPIPADTRVSITNTAQPKGYPITGFTWLVVYKDQNYNNRSLQQAQDLVKLLKWVVTDGQKYTTELDYGALPKEVAVKALANVNSVNFGGKKI